MKILIGSLQVNSHASKGHFHPALELGLSCKKKGHEVILLPLPCEFGGEEKEHLKHVGLPFLSPPEVKASLKTKEELARLASDPELTWQAYYSFLLVPLMEQFSNIVKTIELVAPDVVIYDMLAYGSALSARKLGIPDIGYCAGLKLIAPERFLKSYKSYKEKLTPLFNEFLRDRAVNAKFRHLELLSEYGQFVFTPQSFIKDLSNAPIRTHLVGPLPLSRERNYRVSKPLTHENFAILSLGSVFDPADFPDIFHAIAECTKRFKLKLLVASKKLSDQSHCLPKHIQAFPYLPLPLLLKQAVLIFHHGGANSFSEALSMGTPQVIIPLSNDQPIQAHYLLEAGLPFVIAPGDVNLKRVSDMLEIILDQNQFIHGIINSLCAQFQSECGTDRAIDLVDKLIKEHRERSRT